jgi:hypothetical protein
MFRGLRNKDRVVESKVMLAWRRESGGWDNLFSETSWEATTWKTEEISG